jgi:hypothetical protein
MFMVNSQQEGLAKLCVVQFLHLIQHLDVANMNISWLSPLIRFADPTLTLISYLEVYFHRGKPPDTVYVCK